MKDCVLAILFFVFLATYVAAVLTGAVVAIIIAALIIWPVQVLLCWRRL